MKRMNNLCQMNLSKVTEQIRLRKLGICVVGIGRIGLPTALSCANSGFSTIGVDINKKLIDMINSNNFPLKDEPGYDSIFYKVIDKKIFQSTLDFSNGVNSSDIIILSLPTPMNSQNIPDYSALIDVCQKLNKIMDEGKLIIIESTVEPSFVENILIPIIESHSKNYKAGKDFLIGVCPETANPGEILNDFRNLPRLVGSINENTTEIISFLYKTIFDVEILKMPDCKTANAVKLTTNVFRDINIAFVNELAILYEKLEIDIMTVLEAAKRKYNFQIHFPGAGVGGPCLPVNSYQLLNTENQFNKKILDTVSSARKTNEKMPEHVINLISDAFNEIGADCKNKIICVLGISYKPNVKDIQITPAEKIIKNLSQNNTIKIFDPFFTGQTIFSNHVEENMEQALENADCAVIVTGHKEFHSLSPSFLLTKLKSPIVVDCTGIIDPKSAFDSGLIYRGIGRGKKFRKI